MRLCAGAILAAMMAVQISCKVSAATLKPTVMKDGRVVILIAGELTPGDADSFKAAVKNA